jgi:cystathionine beta-lyase/cystathionine gamma-synthase
MWYEHLESITHSFFVCVDETTSTPALSYPSEAAAISADSVEYFAFSLSGQFFLK